MTLEVHSSYFRRWLTEREVSTRQEERSTQVDWEQYIRMIFIQLLSTEQTSCIVAFPFVRRGSDGPWNSRQRSEQ